MYWRRRFITLVLGLSLLALVAWAFSGSLGGSPPAATAAVTKKLTSGPPTPAASPVASTTHTPATSPSPGPPRHGRKRSSAGLLPCPAGAVVLSLFSSQSSYSIKQTPEFTVDVVSTAAQSCTFDIGSAHVVLRISAGALTVWSNSECGEGEASLVTELRRGIPTVMSVGWTGQHSSPGCALPRSAAAHGGYTVVATDGSLRSNALAVHIG